MLPIFIPDAINLNLVNHLLKLSYCHLFYEHKLNKMRVMIDKLYEHR